MNDHNLVFSEVAKVIKAAMGGETSDPDLIVMLYDLVAMPANLKNSKRESICVEKSLASKIMNRQAGGEVRKDIRMHAKNPVVISEIEHLTYERVICRISERNQEELKERLVDLIERDQSISRSNSERLLTIAKSESLAKFVGMTLLYVYTTPNVSESVSIMNSIQKRVLLLLNGETRKAQRKTCENLAKWLKKEEARKLLLERITILNRQHSELQTECQVLFRRERAQMPVSFAAMIEKKLSRNNIEAMMLLILWAIFQDNISLLSFLYNKYDRKTIDTMSTDNRAEMRLQPHMISANPVYIGNESLLCDIQRILIEENHFVFLQGMGGIGKTETAKQYARKYSERYDTVIFAEFNNSIISLFNDNTVFTITKPFQQERFRNTDGSIETDEEFYKRKLASFRRAANERTLIILDNVDKQDPAISDFLTGICHVIITTRWRSQEIYPDNTITLNETCELRDCIKIFSSYYGKDLSDDNFANKLITHFSCHILALELCAKQMRISGLTTEAMYKTILEKNEANFDEGFLLPGRCNTELSWTEHIQQIFNVSNLNDKERYILSCMSLMPKSGLRKKHVRDFCGCNNYKEINNLVQRSWLRELDGVITIHTLINEAVQITIKPSLLDCISFVHRILDEFSSLYCYHAEIDVKNKIYNIASHLYTLFPEPNMEMDFFYEWAELIFSHCDHPVESLELSKKLYVYYASNYKTPCFKTIRMLCRIGCNERNFNHQDKSIELLEFGRNWLIRNHRNKRELVYLSDVDEILAALYIRKYKLNYNEKYLECAEECGQEFIRIRNKLFPLEGMEYKTAFSGYLILARVAIYMNQVENARHYLQLAEKSYECHEDKVKLYSMNYVKSEFAEFQEDYKAAAEYLEDAFACRESYFGDGLSGDSTVDYLEKKVALGKLYEKMKQKEKALGVYQDIFDSIHSLTFFKKECRIIIELIKKLEEN